MSKSRRVHQDLAASGLCGRQWRGRFPATLEREQEQVGETGRRGRQRPWRPASCPCSRPMSKGTRAPPEMAMHMRPLSSLARSGLSSTVIEKSIGQILAKPSPAATMPAKADGLRAGHEGGSAHQAEKGGQTEAVARAHDGQHGRRPEDGRWSGGGRRGSGRICWPPSHPDRRLPGWASGTAPCEDSAPT